MCEARDGRPMRSGGQSVTVPEPSELRTKFLANAGEGHKCVDMKAESDELSAFMEPY